MRSDIELTNAYRDFLKICIDTLDPKLIITLGIPSAWFVGPLVGNAWRCGWKSLARLRMADLNTDPVKTASGLVFVAATHPSHPQNRKHRRFSAEDVNEVGLITRARRMAGIPNL
jgi:uracil-DNA glycosylase